VDRANAFDFLKRYLYRWRTIFACICHFEEQDERKFITINCARRNLLDGRFLAPLEMTESSEDPCHFDEHGECIFITMSSARRNLSAGRFLAQPVPSFIEVLDDKATRSYKS
jgi:hypothetical protein